MTNKEIIEHLLSIKKWGILTDRDRQALNLVIKELEKRTTGGWIRHISSIECSVCKEKFFSTDEDENCQDYDPCSDYNFNYCPNCGADMRKGEEE